MTDQERQFLSQLKEASKEIKKKPGQAEGYLKRAQALVGLGRLEQARVDLDRAIELQPAQAKPYLQRGAVWLQLKRPDHALRDLDEALRLDPNDARAYYFRGMVYRGPEDAERAIEDWTNYLQCEPDDGEGYRRRGVLRALTGDARLAVADLTSAIARGSTDLGVRWLRAQAYEQADDLARAEREYLAVALAVDAMDEAGEDEGAGPADVPRSAKRPALNNDERKGVAVDSEWRSAWLRRADVLARLGRGEEVGECLERVRAPLDESPLALLLRGAVLHESGEYAEAESVLTRAIEAIESVEADENGSAARSRRAAVREELGKLDEALADLKRVCRLEPDSGAAWAGLARLQARCGLYAEALEALEKAISLGMDGDMFQLMRANILVDLDRFDEAEREFHALLAKFPLSPLANTHAARLYERMGRHEEAIDRLSLALRGEPHSPAILVRRGKLYGALGRTSEALRDFSRLVKLYPDSAESYLER